MCGLMLLVGKGGNMFVYKAIGWGIGALVVLILLLVQNYKDKHDK